MVQERHNKAFDYALERLEDQREQYDENMKKVYMKIFDEYCTPAMQHQLQQHPDFNNQLKDDPIETLKAIEILIHDPVRVVYPMEALTDALKNFLLARQNKNETTMDYVKRRKQLGATLLQFLRPNVLDHYMKTTKWYSEAN